MKFYFCKRLLFFTLFLFVILLSVIGLEVYTTSSDSECISHITENIPNVMVTDLGTAMRKGFWACAKDIALKLQAKGIDIRTNFDLEGRTIQKEITALKNVIESNLPQSSITPAFQWAQSPNEILLNVKFAHKLDAPATLNVEVTSVDLTPNTLVLQASDGRKNFKLEIEFLKAISPENSTWSMASVGRMTFNIKKDQTIPSNWPRLLLSKKKLPAMHFWWEMQEKYSKELEALSDEDSLSNKTSSSINSTETTVNKTDSKLLEPKLDESPEEKARNLEKRKIDKETSGKIKELEDNNRKRKLDIDSKAIEEKGALDKELDVQKKELKDAAEVRKKALMDHSEL